MHVLHAHWHFPTTPTETGGMLWWAETATTEAVPKKGRRSRAAPPHPFCADPTVVKQLLGTLVRAVPGSQANWLTLLLPTTAARPQPSPQLLHDWDIDPDGPMVLSPWVVAGGWLSLGDAFDVLANLPDAEDMPVNLALLTISRG